RRRHGRARDRLQPRLLVHILHALLRRARGPGDAPDPGGGGLRGNTWRRTGIAPHRRRPSGHRRPSRPAAARRPVVPVPRVPARGAPRVHRPAQRSADMKAATVTVAPTGIEPGDVIAVARERARVVLSDAALDAMRASRAIVDDIERSGRPVYGVSTGFGALASTSIAPERRAELQHALIRSHAAGVGAPMPAEVVRAMILLR